MLKKTYDFTVINNDEEVNVSLRLSVNGEMKLKEKYKKSTTEIITDAVNDIEVMCDLLTQCLNYKDNTNTIKKGSELYEIMVDNDMGGMRNWQKITTEIAYISGKYDAEERDAIINQVNIGVQKLLDGDITELEKNLQNP